MSSLDFFLKEELIKIARTKSASYADHLAKILEAKTTKYSSIEDALSDFASRLGIKESELELLKKAALVKSAQFDDKTLQKLKDEGLLNPSAIEFMGRQKNKHTKDSPSPFAINKDKANQIIKQIQEQRAPSFDTPGVETQLNEMSNVSTGNLRLKLLIEKYAQKVLDLKPSLENIEKLKRELAGGEIETGFKISRYGFEFSDISGGMPKPGSPIKITAYEYSFNKDRLIKEINSSLRKQLEEDLPFDSWIKFIEEKISEGILDSKTGYDLTDKLEIMKKQLFGTEGELLDPTKKKYTSVALKKILKLFPSSYQEKILKMLAAGEYRHLLPEISGRLKAEVYPSSYRKSSFLMMSSFAPYLALSLDPSRDQLKALIKRVVELKKANWTGAELEALVKELGIDYSKNPSALAIQKLPLHEKVIIKVENEENTNYKPLTLEKTPSSLEEQEKMLQGLHDQVFEAVRANLPLAYKPTPEGGHEEVRLSDLKQDLDFTKEQLPIKLDQEKTIQVENKNLGLHPSFKGTIEKPKAKSLDLLKTTPTKKELPIPSLDLGLESPSKETPSSEKIEESKASPSFQDLLKKLKERKGNFAGQIRIAEAGLFMSEDGTRFSSLQEMKSKLLGEMALEMRSEILDRVAKALLPLIAGSEVIEFPTREVERLPLAARLRLKILEKTSSEKAKPKLAKLLERLER